MPAIFNRHDNKDLPLEDHVTNPTLQPVYHNLVPAQLKMLIREMAAGHVPDWSSEVADLIAPRYEIDTDKIPSGMVSIDDSMIRQTAPGYEFDQALEILTDRISERDLDMVLNLTGTLSAMLMEANLERHQAVMKDQPATMPRSVTSNITTLSIPRSGLRIKTDEQPRLTWRQWLAQGWQLLR